MGAQQVSPSTLATDSDQGLLEVEMGTLDKFLMTLDNTLFSLKTESGHPSGPLMN